VLAALAAFLTLGVLATTFAITSDQDDFPAWWFVALVVVALAGLLYGTTSGPRRGPVLRASSGLVLLLGLLALASVGWPLVIAGAAGLVAAQARLVSSPGAAAP
jgi:hypothetical protein